MTDQINPTGVAQSAREAALEAAALDFIAKVERGEARSTKSYAAFKAALDTGLPTANDVRGILAAQPPAAPVETTFQSLEGVILFVLKDMRACGSWDVKTMDRVVENVEQIFRSPSLPPRRSSAETGEAK